MTNEIIEIYTDGSCHTQHCIGAWVAIIFVAGQKTILSGQELDTTHNRMEIKAVIKAIEYVNQLNIKKPPITIITDSQYVKDLQGKAQKFTVQKFKTKKGSAISNEDLVKKLLVLINFIAVEFVKIKAHQKSTAVVNYNIEADKLSRRIVRKAVKELQIL